MYQQDNILKELQDLSPTVAGIARINVFTVPAGYFETLSGHILLQLNDAEELFALTDANRDYLSVWLPWLDAINSVTDTKKFIESTLEAIANKRSFVAAICDEDLIVGLIGYNHIDRQNRIGYIGYWLAEDERARLHRSAVIPSRSGSSDRSPRSTRLGLESG